MPPSKPSDHRGWSAYWGEEAIAAMNRVISGKSQGVTMSGELLDLQHVKRCARAAWYHACRVSGYKYWDNRWTEDPK